MAWIVTAGPLEFESLGSRDMDIGWAYDLERDGAQATASVLVAGGRLNASDLPTESKRAIATNGRSAIEPLLNRDELPHHVIVTSFGLREE